MNDHLISRRSFVRNASLVAASTLVTKASLSTLGKRKTDVCIYGATSGGIIAAVTLAKLGRSVLLVEPARHVGGMTTGGLSYIDYGRKETIGGLTKQYFDEVRAYYTKDGVTEGNGWSVEPHVAEQIFEEWISKNKIEVLRESRISSVRKEKRRIHSITLDKGLVDHRGAPSPNAQEKKFVEIEAKMFLDCSYEGDLLAMAGVSFRTDREGRNEYGESLAGVKYLFPDSNGMFGPEDRKRPPKALLKLDPYRIPGKPSSGLLPLTSSGKLHVEGSRHPVFQAYNFRLCLTNNDPIPIAPPTNYDPSYYELVYRYINALEKVDPLWVGDLYWGYGHKKERHEHPRLLKITELVRGKADLNNAGVISMDYVTGGAQNYPTGSWGQRAQIWHAHEDYQRGFLYFLRTDERLPDWLRKEVAKWGLPKDEFPDTGGWPTQIYVRQGRRMVSNYIITQKDCDTPKDRNDSIGMGSYSLDSHLCQRLVKDGYVINEGGFFHQIAKPYPIPYGVITPTAQECENLLVPFCVSSTHVAFASFRMEPPFMILSESAGYAADESLRNGTSVQGISVSKLRQRLKDNGQLV